MRSAPELQDILMSDEKVFSAKIVFRDNLLVFSKRQVDDGLDLSDPSDADLSAYGTGFLRVVNYNDILYTQYVNDPSQPASFPGVWPLWVNSGIQLMSESRPGVEGGKIWYQKTNGDLCYRDYANFSSEIFVTANYSTFPCSVAPVSNGAYVQYKNGAWISLSYASLDGCDDWVGRIYGDIQSVKFLDAVTLDGSDYVYYMDRDVGRICEMERVGNNWGAPSYVLPIDAIDTSYGLTLSYASVINERVFLTGRLTRTSDGSPISMDVYTVGPKMFSFGRELFVTEFNVGGKMLLIGNKMYCVGVNSVMEADATNYAGNDNLSKKIETSDIAALSFSEAENGQGKIDLSIPYISNSIVKRGAEVELLVGYNENLIKIATGEIDTISSSITESGRFSSLSARPKSIKRLSQFVPDQGIYIPSQAKMSSHPSTMDKVIRAKGLYDTKQVGEVAPLSLLSLNEDGVLYSSARASRGGIMRAKFYVPSGDNFSAAYGVGINYYQESRQEAAERLLINYNDVTENLYGDNGILAIIEDGLLTIRLWTDSQFAVLATTPLPIPENTWHWLQIYFHEGYIKADYHLDSDSIWTTALSLVYENSLRTPWKREALGRGCIYMKNKTPSSTTPGFFAGDEIIPVIPSSFPVNSSIKVGGTVYEYENVSEDEMSDAMQVYIDPHFKARVSDFPGFPIAVPITGTIDNQYVGYSMFVESGSGAGRSFRIVGFDYAAPQVWVPSGTYTSPDKWQDHVGDPTYGSWSPSLTSVIYVSQDPSGVIGNDSVVKIFQGITLTEPAISGSANSAASFYSELSVLCDYCSFYSQELDFSVADALVKISSLAGCKASSRDEVGGELSVNLVSDIGNGHKDFIADLTLPELASGDGIGWIFRSSSNLHTDGYSVVVEKSGISYYATLTSLTNGQIQERVPLWFTPKGNFRLSVHEADFGVWINGVLAHVFHNADFSTGEYAAVVSKTPKTIKVSISQLDDIVSDVIMGTTGNALSAINEVIADRKIYFSDNQDGSLEFYKARDDAGNSPDIVISEEKSENDSVVSRARIEGLLIGEAWDFDALREYGNMYSLMNSRFSESVDGIILDGRNSMQITNNSSRSHVFECLTFPVYQPGDALFIQGRKIRISSVSIKASISENEIATSMGIYGVDYG